MSWSVWSEFVGRGKELKSREKPVYLKVGHDLVVTSILISELHLAAREAGKCHLSLFLSCVLGKTRADFLGTTMGLLSQSHPILTAILGVGLAPPRFIHHPPEM